MKTAFIPYIKLKQNMKNLNKEQAIERLSAIEKETADLRKIIENADKPRPIKERVFDIPSAIAELGEGDLDVIEYRKMIKADLSRKTLSGQEITLFCKAVNEGVKNEGAKIDLTDENTQKWFIWFDCRKKVGSGFIDCFDYRRYSSGSLPARHLYATRDLSEHGSKCIEKIYYEYILA